MVSLVSRTNQKQPEGATWTNYSSDKLSVDELLELKANIELAARAAIRERNKPKLIASNPAEAAPTKTIDLQSEARAWMAARRESRMPPAFPVEGPLASLPVRNWELNRNALAYRSGRIRIALSLN